LRDGDLSNIVDCLREVAGVGAGSVAVLTCIVGVALIGVGLAAARKPLPAVQAVDGAPLPRWCGKLLLGGGGLGAVALYLLVPRFVFEPARRMLAYHGYSAAEISRELQLLHILLVGFALATAAVGLVLLGWRTALRAADRLPRWGGTMAVPVGGSVAALLLAPLLLVWAIGLCGVPFVQSRNLLILVPVLAVAAALGLDALCRRRAGRFVAEAAIVLLGVSAVQYSPCARPLGSDGRVLGMHTSSAWREAAAVPELRASTAPLMVADVPTTDPALYYLAEHSPRRISSAREMMPASGTPPFLFLHLENAPVSAEFVQQWTAAGARLTTLWRNDGLTLLSVGPSGE
jgi:hypothetical protein